MTFNLLSIELLDALEMLQMPWHTSDAHEFFIILAKEFYIFLVVMDAFCFLDILSIFRKFFIQVINLLLELLPFFFFLSQKSLLSDCHISYAIAFVTVKVNHPILDFFIFDLLLKAFPTNFMHTVKEHVFDYFLMLASLHFI